MPWKNISGQMHVLPVTYTLPYRLYLLSRVSLHVYVYKYNIYGHASQYSGARSRRRRNKRRKGKAYVFHIIAREILNWVSCSLGYIFIFIIYIYFFFFLHPAKDVCNLLAKEYNSKSSFSSKKCFQN